MRTHELKTWPEYFEPVWDEWKTFDIRYDDRAYQPADEVVLREFAPHVVCLCQGRRHVATCAKYTGRFITATVGHMTASTPARGNQRGFRGDGYVVLSLVNVTRGGVGKDPGSQDAPDSSDAPSPVSDESLPSNPERPAATPPSPTSIAGAARRRRSREVLERSRVDEHIAIDRPRVAYSSGGGAS